MLDFLVLYSTTTGNTKEVATAIFNALPGTSKELCDIRDYHYDKEASLYFVGFWTNRGTGDRNTLSVLSSLHNKKIALFGTCGMGQSTAYFHTIANNVSAFIAEDCEYLGSFLCQGRMPQQVLAKYQAMQKERPADAASIEQWIANYNEALHHPDDQDLVNAQTFADNILKTAL